MTGPEHYRAAEQLLAANKTPNGAVVIDSGTAEVLAAAQVHATLALAAATAMSGRCADDGERGMHSADFTAWDKAAGVPE